jgi:hypothetical protein
MGRSGPWLRLATASQEALISGARDANPVSGLTHGFYKYPARFSPTFVRAAIETFTKPGELVLDPHVGGGTTLVEARALGREGIGVDISPLAEFVARVKSTVYSEAELETLSRWASCVPYKIDIHRPSTEFADYAELGYYKHLDHPSRLRKSSCRRCGVRATAACGAACPTVAGTTISAAKRRVAKKSCSSTAKRIPYEPEVNNSFQPYPGNPGRREAAFRQAQGPGRAPASRAPRSAFPDPAGCHLAPPWSG